MNISVVPVPNKSVRFALHDKQWQVCTQSWNKITGFALQLSEDDFKTHVVAANSLSTFLLSYLRESCEELDDHLSDDSRRISSVRSLSRNVYVLCIRLLKSPQCPTPLLSFKFMSDFARYFGSSNATSVQDAIDTALEDNSEHLLRDLTDEQICERPAAYIPLCLRSNTTASLLARSQLARAIALKYDASNSDKRALRRLSFLVLSNKQSSVKFLDALIQDDPKRSLLQDLIVRSDLLQTLGTLTADRPGLEDLLSTLLKRYGPDSDAGQVSSSDGRDEAVELLSRISQIQDLFPDLGEGYIEACLDAFDQDVEITTMHLLENDLPPHINGLDTKMKSSAAADVKQPAQRDVPDLPALPLRENIYNDDQFDRLAHDKRQVTQGRRLSNNADIMLKQQLSLEQKAKVLALAYDPDDDELDDTYDQFEGTGGLDMQTNDDLADAAAPSLPSIDDLLFLAHESNPSIFEQSSRKSPGRQDLRAKTNLSDEQIEGWKVMLDREPARARKLADKYAFAGKQSEVESSRWSADESHKSDAQQTNSDRSGRGRGRGGRGTRGQQTGQGPMGRTQEQIKRDRAKKETRGNGRGRGRGGGMRGQARPQG